MSLLHTVKALDRSQYSPIVALIRPAPAVEALYRNNGIELVCAPGIRTWEHTTAYSTEVLHPSSWYRTIDTLAYWRRSEALTLALIDRVQPDLVHLNSVVLVPSARALHRARVPFVWHVRESPVTGLVGARLAVIRRGIRRWPAETIFLTAAERQRWTRGSTGQVIPNFVDVATFQPTKTTGELRSALGLAAEHRAIAYLGGLAPMKGIFVLLEALARARRRDGRIVCIMAGAVYEKSNRIRSRAARAILPVLGSGTLAQRVDAKIRALDLEAACKRIPFVSDVVDVIAACDVVVFPALKNHFARPVIEAAMLSKPVIASRLPSIEELVETGASGMLVPPGDAGALADALVALADDPAEAVRLGANAHRQAVRRFSASENGRAIMDIYDRVLSRGRSVTDDGLMPSRVAGERITSR